MPIEQAGTTTPRRPQTTNRRNQPRCFDRSPACQDTLTRTGMLLPLAYAALEAFEADLYRHVHLENDVPFPVARRLEATLTTLS